MPEKIKTLTDPAVMGGDGNNRIFWVGFAASQEFPRRSGKAVDLHHRFQKATASSSNLAGFLQMDSAGVTDGHPASIAAGDELPVNFGADKTHVFPTSGRAAVATDVGKRFDIAVDADGIQFIDLSNSSKAVLQVTDVMDESGGWVRAKIPADKRYGYL